MSLWLDHDKTQEHIALQNANQSHNNQPDSDEEGDGYARPSDHIISKHHQSKPTMRKSTKYLIIMSFILLFYCTIGVSYILFFSASNNQQCDCIKPITTDTIDNKNIGNKSNNTNYPTSSPTSQYISYKHSIGDYKISIQNKSHDNWLLCDGSFIDPNYYNQLYNLIGYSFGSKISNTVKLFALPDVTNHVIGFNGNRFKIGDIIGKENMTLDIENIPSHSHFTMHAGSCHNTQSSTDEYLIQNCGLWKNSIDAYNLVTTKSLPDSVPTAEVGNGKSFDLYQPTIYIGNLFIYADEYHD